MHDVGSGVVPIGPIPSHVGAKRKLAESSEASISIWQGSMSHTDTDEGVEVQVHLQLLLKRQTSTRGTQIE